MFVCLSVGLLLSVPANLALMACALHSSHSSILQQALDLLNYLVRKGVNPQSADSLGNFPFVYSLCCGHLKVAAGLVCLTKSLASNWKISHPSLNILKHQQVGLCGIGGL